MPRHGGGHDRSRSPRRERSRRRRSRSSSSSSLSSDSADSEEAALREQIARLEDEERLDGMREKLAQAQAARDAKEEERREAKRARQAEQVAAEKERLDAEWLTRSTLLMVEILDGVNKYEEDGEDGESGSTFMMLRKSSDASENIVTLIGEKGGGDSWCASSVL